MQARRASEWVRGGLACEIQTHSLARRACKIPAFGPYEDVHRSGAKLPFGASAKRFFVGEISGMSVISPPNSTLRNVFFSNIANDLTDWIPIVDNARLESHEVAR